MPVSNNFMTYECRCRTQTITSEPSRIRDAARSCCVLQFLLQLFFHLSLQLLLKPFLPFALLLFLLLEQLPLFLAQLQLLLLLQLSLFRLKLGVPPL